MTLSLLIGFSLILLISNVLALESTSKCGQQLNTSSLSEFIVGGQDSMAGEFPWHVQIGFDRCGATLVTDQWAVTAGHCVANESGHVYPDLTAYVGVTIKEKKTFAQHQAKLTKVVLHPEFKRNSTQRNDIAMIKIDYSNVSQSINSLVSPICLPDAISDHAHLTDDCWVIGFGEDQVINETKMALQKMSMSITKDSFCQIWYDEYNRTEELCATAEDYKGTCFGDSGSGFQCRGTDGRFYHLGVVSLGSPPCKHSDVLEVFTKVTSYVDWIRHVIMQN